MRSENLDKHQNIWLFGYGSLIWRPGFPFLRREAGWVEGWARRFWQASPDHRGTVEQPGRVVTLIRDEGARCWGAAYEIAADLSEAVLQSLDVREQAGYERVKTKVFMPNHAPPHLDVLMYVAKEDNPCFLGPCSRDELIRQIRASSGPSGSNLEYLRELAVALRKMGAEAPEVFSVEESLEEAEL